MHRYQITTCHSNNFGGRLWGVGCLQQTLKRHCDGQSDRSKADSHTYLHAIARSYAAHLMTWLGQNKGPRRRWCFKSAKTPHTWPGAPNESRSQNNSPIKNKNRSRSSCCQSAKRAQTLEIVSLRRRVATTPTKPMPNRASDTGSGTALIRAEK